MEQPASRIVTELLVDLGPTHPTMDGAPLLDLVIDADGAIAAAQLVVGMVHRGAEKLLESRDYPAGLALSDRHDWLGAFCSEFGLARTVEDACGIVVPTRARIIRILLAELNRVGHHLAFLAALPGADPSWARPLWELREATLGAMEAVTGQRIHPMFVVIGGVRADLPEAVLETITASLPQWRASVAAAGPGLAQLLARTYRGLAVLRPGDAVELGASGPVSRASGVALDLRASQPGLGYPKALRVVTDQTGHAAARIGVLAGEIPVSLDLIAWGLAELARTPGPVNVRLPKVLRVPAGTNYGAFENPGGINGYLLVSRNEPLPYRVKIRSAGFGNAMAAQHALTGVAAADLAPALASFFLLSGDIDR